MEGIDLFPLILSFRVAGTATLVTVLAGFPMAYMLARGKFPGRNLLDSLLSLPIILPPTVLGYYLLVALGRRSPVGLLYEKVAGHPLIFTPTAAVVAASVVSLPLFVKSARAALESVDPDLEKAARTVGLGEFQILARITVPLASRGIIAGTVLAFARALGDFGTTLMVAGSIPGRTQTVPIAIYEALQSGNMEMANTLVAVVSAVAVLALLAITRTANLKL